MTSGLKLHTIVFYNIDYTCVGYLSLFIIYFIFTADTSPFVTEIEHPAQPTEEGRSRRKKRQVPCENGEGLDEYVDTLIRFGRRLLRFQVFIMFF